MYSIGLVHDIFTRIIYFGIDRTIGSARSGYPVEGAAALGFRQAFYAVHRA